MVVLQVFPISSYNSCGILELIYASLLKLKYMFWVNAVCMTWKHNLETICKLTISFPILLKFVFVYVWETGRPNCSFWTRQVSNSFLIAINWLWRWIEFPHQVIPLCLCSVCSTPQSSPSHMESHWGLGSAGWVPTTCTSPEPFTALDPWGALWSWPECEEQPWLHAEGLTVTHLLFSSKFTRKMLIVVRT